MLLNIFSNQNFCHLCELFLWILGSFLIGYFFWRWWYNNKCQNEINDWKTKYKDLEHEINTTVKASKVTAPGVFDPNDSEKNFVDGIAKASSLNTHTSSSLAEKSITKDDLTKIEGIGPKIKGLLNDDDIWSFNQLSETSVKQIQGILDKAGPRYRVHNPGNWPKQAKLAAQDDWEELKKLQNSLKGGR